MAQQYVSPMSGNVTMAFGGAVRHVKGILIHPAPDDFLGKKHPDYQAQQQALTYLEWTLAGADAAIPYRKLDATSLLPTKGSWALFQLFEAIQLRKAHQAGKVPDVTIDDVIEAFKSVGTIGKRWTIFPDCDVSPEAQRRVLRQPGLFAGRDLGEILIRLHEAPGAKVVATLTDRSGSSGEIPLPDGFFISIADHPDGVWEFEP